MTTNKLVSKGLLLGLCFTLFLPQVSHGFNGSAHERLTRRAVGDPPQSNASQLNDFLMNNLGFDFPQGINEPISGGQSPIDLIADGSVKEDSPPTRVLHHFHDPTRTWNQAGENLSGFPLGNSSIVWSQLVPQGACCGNFAWKDARDAYYTALTRTTTSERKSWFAKTFEILGHLLHHVQDAAVPAHTRNDFHFAPSERSTFPLGDRFHFWAENNLDVIDARTGVRPEY
jgi:hypothetical protein